MHSKTQRERNYEVGRKWAEEKQRILVCGRTKSNKGISLREISKIRKKRKNNPYDRHRGRKGRMKNKTDDRMLKGEIELTTARHNEDKSHN